MHFFRDRVFILSEYVQRVSLLEFFLRVSKPQNSMPDVVIWMLSGEDRVAYYRIPAYDLLYNENPAYCGQHCKKVLDMELKVRFFLLLFAF